VSHGEKGHLAIAVANVFQIIKVKTAKSQFHARMEVKMALYVLMGF